MDQAFAGRTEEITVAAYRILARLEQDAQPQPNKIIISLPESGSLPNRTFGNGDVMVNALCIRINDEKYSMGGSSEICLNMKDGSTFVVRNGQMDNTICQLSVEDGLCLCMLNSAVNIDDIVSVEAIGTTQSATLLPD